MAKSDKPTFPTPKTAEEAGELLARLGQAAATLAKTVARRDAMVQRITARLNAALAPSEELVAAMAKALKKFADKNRAALCAEGSKTIKLPTGDLYWKTGDEAVQVTEDFEDIDIVEALQEHGFHDCVRISETLDKEAIKRLWPMLTEKDLTGLRLVKREFFYLLPLGMADAMQMKTKAVEVVDELDGNPKPKTKKE